MPRNQTIEILNEADSFQSRLNSILFVQETAIDYSTPGWVPGEPLYTDPRMRGIFEQGRQHVRPMIEDLGIDQFHFVGDDDGPWPDRDSEWCKDCLVAWSGSGPCWWCGAEILRAKSYSDEVLSDSPLAYLRMSDIDRNLVTYTFDLALSMEEIHRIYRDMWSRVSDQAHLHAHFWLDESALYSISTPEPVRTEPSVVQLRVGAAEILEVVAEDIFEQEVVLDIPEEIPTTPFVGLIAPNHYLADRINNNRAAWISQAATEMRRPREV